ncbi:hypothetical protein acsn021_05250 [Anaerocolumna cellulosilytica]|uniref:Uncharacterized protein n=1 Tax=Anaerocolumna cellulosilytica TaxID=433286 RepID=A0A6S6QTG3_9FIRM|nr:glycosyltransferase [Anaerocolumna cellulosilytica]MBB5195708.1 hypothetical protein [Anaerocolumna cellulosilytica]BCJ92956.1 hypothetical protein acsn021_05250 [Anaerocolumna cellulosilytica]
MVLRNSTMLDFVNVVKNKKLYCFGAGSVPNEICSKYPELKLESYIYRFIDNSSILQGTKKKVGTSDILVISVEEFLKEVDESTVVLFTLYAFLEAFEQLDTVSVLDTISCYIYRMIVAADYDFQLAQQKIPENGLLYTGSPQIPKKIHYCWFGYNELPDLAKRCIESWKKFCPNYEIIRWDETNYDVSKNKYMHKAYKDRKWAFVSDYARLDIVNDYGGIYLDTDVELVKSLDSLLYEKGFCGFESNQQVAFGLGFGAHSNNKVVADLLKLYDTLEWDGGKTPCPVFQTSILKKHGLIEQNSFQRLKDMTILPAECLCPKSIMSSKISVTPRTFAIHHYAASWYEYTQTEIEFLKLWERVQDYE